MAKRGKGFYNNERLVIVDFTCILNGYGACKEFSIYCYRVFIVNLEKFYGSPSESRTTIQSVQVAYA